MPLIWIRISSGVLLQNFHWLWHWAQKSVTNDEDWAGTIKTCVAAPMSGTTMELVPQKVMERVQWGMHFMTVNQ